MEVATQGLESGSWITVKVFTCSAHREVTWTCGFDLLRAEQKALNLGTKLKSAHWFSCRIEYIRIHTSECRGNRDWFTANLRGYWENKEQKGSRIKERKGRISNKLLGNNPLDRIASSEIAWLFYWRSTIRCTSAHCKLAPLINTPGDLETPLFQVTR